MERELAPMRARAEEIRVAPARVDDVLAAGAAHAREVAGATMRDAKESMGLT
jgi:tryptophanyl-tRNA synthetase